MKFFVKRDLDGFFALFIDNLVQLLMIITFCQTFCGMRGAASPLLYQVILPGSAVSILFGNLFYAWQAHRLAKKTGRDDVTALPYGINTPSVIVYIYFVMMPTYQATNSATQAWLMGVIACLGSGIIEFVGSFAGGFIRRQTPRAALLSTLAGIAVGFISMTFALQIFQKPLIALLPLVIVLIGFFSQIRLPLGLPSGFLAIVIGTAIAWGMTALQSYFPNAPQWMTYGAGSSDVLSSSTQQLGLAAPIWCFDYVLTAIQDVERWVPLLSVVIPMGLFNVVGSLQNIESAEAAGDSYPTGPSMAANGLGTILAAMFGSCFPTTIYIGHPGWKSLGARAGYSTLNGIAIVAICLTGLVSLVAGVVPIEVGAGIVLWIGVIITAQAFRAVPENHAPAVAIGLFPAIAAWGATIMLGTFLVALEHPTLQAALTTQPTAMEADTAEPLPLNELFAELNAVDSDSSPDSAEAADPSVIDSKPTDNEPAVADADESTGSETATPLISAISANGFLLHGLLLMERGYIFTCMILAATAACLIDRRFIAAGVWLIIASVLTWLGVIHSYQIYDGMVFDYLFRFVPPQEGAYFYRANDAAVAYLISGLFLVALNRWAESRPEQSH